MVVVRDVATTAGRAASLTIVIAVKNGSSTLARCLDSIRRQVGCKIQTVVVDGLSTDSTQDIVAASRDVVDIYIRDSDDGIYDAWNKALNVLSAPWCMFLGADDELIGDGAARSIMACTTETEGVAPDIVVGRSLMIGSSGQQELRLESTPLHSLILSGRMVPHTGSLMSVAAIRSVGEFSTDFQIFGDREILLRFCEHGFNKVHHCDEVIARVAYGGASSRWDLRYQRHRELYRLLHPRIGRPRAAAKVAWIAIHEDAVGLFERTLITAFGHKVGRPALLSLRKRLDRAPRLKSDDR